MDEATKKKVNSFVRSHSKIDLQKMCKERQKSQSGTKYDMALRVLEVTEKCVTCNPKTEKTPSALILKIVKNQFGNYAHHDSGMVFDPNTKRVIGVQLSNGNVRPLQRSDIEICQKYKFQFNIPTSLDPSPIFEILENSDNEDKEGSEKYSDDEDEDVEDCDDDVEDI
jgi:hypothetical protein